MTTLPTFLRVARTVAVLLSVSPAAGRAAEDDPLAAGFREPPLEARPSVYWDWLNGSVSLPQLTRDLEAMKAVGLRGADIFDVGAVNSPRYHYRLYPLGQNDDVVPVGPPFLGPKPVRSAGLNDYRRRDREVRALANKLWGPCDGKTVLEHAFGRGRVIWGRPLREILEQRGVGPDFDVPGRDEKAGLDYVHRRTEEADIYFVRNKTERPVAADCVFRVSDKAPELWSPDGGRIRPQLVYDEVKGGTRLPIRLPAWGSVFVVFRNSAEKERVVALSKDGRQLFPSSPPASPADVEECAAPDVVRSGADGPALLAREPGTYVLRTAAGRNLVAKVDSVFPVRQLAGPWEVCFPTGWGAPESKMFAKLVSWTDDPEAGVKHFSGTATYRKTFDLPADALAGGQRLTLDLGDVRATADVRLNGHPLGILWSPPFRVDISNAAKVGRNELSIEVTNVWRNRLIGDLQLPREKRICRTNLFGKISPRAPLIPSGLLGPVRLLGANQVTALPTP